MESTTSHEADAKGIKRQLSNSPVAQRKTRTSDIVTRQVLANVKNVDLNCKFCDQIVTEDLQVNIPANAESDECIVLAKDDLANIFTDESNTVQHNLTNYAIYDCNGHMCSLDSGVMEKNVKLYLTGYVKPIYDHSPAIEKGYAASNLGPILEWWLTSYDGGSQVIIGISTEFADYLLLEPQSNFKKYMNSVTEKIHLSRLVLDRIIHNENDNPTYEDILNNIISSINPVTDQNFTEDHLMLHAQFVIDQMMDYDANDQHYLPLAETKFFKMLTKLSGATESVIKTTLKRIKGLKPGIDKREFSKATTTELVKDIFENIFAAQLDVDDKENEATIDKRFKAQFSNKPNQKKFPIINREKLCKNMFVSVKSNDSEQPILGRIEYFYKQNSKDKAHLMLFIHSYETVLGEASDPQELFALKNCKNVEIQNVLQILDVSFKKPSDNWVNHGNSKLQDLLEPVDRNNENSYFYQFQYDDEFGRFEYPQPENQKNDNKYDGKYCSNCEIDDFNKKSEIPELLDLIEKEMNVSYFYKFKLHNEVYKIGNFIYLKPGIFKPTMRINEDEVCTKSVKKQSNNKRLNNNINQVMDRELESVDETVYPEFYRKTLENKGSNESTPSPFEIAEILAIYVLDGKLKNVNIVVRRMYRAEQISMDNNESLDMNLLYWSEEEFEISFKDICGKCYVAYHGNIIDSLAWSSKGPDRFYFRQKYDCLTHSLIPEFQLPNAARFTGREVYVNYNYKYVELDYIQFIPSYEEITPLKSLDVFAGCGGLSKGLKDSGLIKSEWAIESDFEAASAFQLNNPESTVFVDDCNHLLKLAMSGIETNSVDQKIPFKGDVDFICGGPPCQGFSGMNRFSSREYSLFTNSLIATFLSYVDFYRPKVFIMENVRNFVSFKKGMVLKLTLRCITRMGYQCTFGIVQAGNFGVPQTRRRLIIMAAAPGQKLPFYPEPIHVFNKKSSGLNIQVDNKKFRTNCKFDEHAPLRTVTVFDAWSDLPAISNGDFLEEIPYNSKPITHLQKLLRSPKNFSFDSFLTEHICKDMSPLVQARISLIPVGEGSDWRDLPNINVKLPDGIISNKLLYQHEDLKNGKNSNGEFRGVCQCATGKDCNPADRQNNTIIPWCLPHTANRHNNWAGLYGRLAWDGYCSTTITNPEPMGKQGRVLHPEQNRVVSVRECARSQGFKDDYQFYGHILNKHRQIGNAVPPPMGKAIGHEIIKSIHLGGY